MVKTKDQPHECKQEDIDSAKFLARDAKPCPSCGALCHKVDGCSQVFCIMCKTAFNYNTLRIEVGVIHAPDYYRWVAQNNNGVVPRNPGDNPCGDLVPLSSLRVHVNSIDKGVYFKVFSDIHRLRNHIQFDEMNLYRVDRNEDNRDLRVKYILKEIDEDKWKRLLQQREKARAKKAEIFAVLDTFVVVARDIFGSIMTTHTKQGLEERYNEFLNLREYYHERLLKISQLFNCVVPKIKGNWGYIINAKASRGDDGKYKLVDMYATADED